MRRIRNLLIALMCCALSAPAMALDCSGTITTGGTAQTVFTSLVRGLLVVNNSANLMCMSWKGTPAATGPTNCAAGSYPLQPGSSTTMGGSFSRPPDIGINTLSIISSTTGDVFSCERQ